MRSSLTRDFRALFERLPPGVQARAAKQFLLWTRDHGHPSLHFKRVGRFWSARVDRDYRVLGLEREGTIHWFYIGPHDATSPASERRPCAGEVLADVPGANSLLMKLPAALFALLCGWLCVAAPPGVLAQVPSVSVVPPGADAVAMPPASINAAAPYNHLVLEQIRTMPQNGGYSAGHEATQRLDNAVQLGAQTLQIDAARAQPSYCSGATYLVFLKTVDALAERGVLPANERVLSPLLITGQRDGQGVWGRWNANGPGTARLFYELNLGPNFSDFAAAQPGDFMKIFWSDAVGRREHGHSVIYLGTERVDGVESVRFWSSNLHVGYSEKSVPRARIKAAVFSRLTNPGNLVRAGSLGARPDPYLASLLSTDSNLAEVRRECGLPPE